MTATRLAVALAAVALSLLLAAPAQAQPATGILHSIGIAIWTASMAATESTGSGSWSTVLWILDYRLSSSSPRRPWGLHLQYATGGQSNWGGTFAGTSSGTDRIWSADVTFRAIADSATFHLFAGYGSLQWETNTRRVTSSGVRVGIEATFPLQSTATGTWALHGAFAWYPSNSVTAVGSTTSGSGAGHDWSVSVRYKMPSGTAGALTTETGDYLLVASAPAWFTPSGHDWAIEVAYREVRFDGGSSYRWSGPLLMIQKTF